MDKLQVIAHIRTDFPDKFGVPRQSGLVAGLRGKIVFEPRFRSKDALKGIEEYTHLWLLWEFEGIDIKTFNATVRPPRLGGNETRGVFATRSPFRPNPIGLSSVKFEGLEDTKEGTVILVSGVDMRDNTPIYDIKPYLAYVDSHPDASDGFAGRVKDMALKVVFPKELIDRIPVEKQEALLEILREDPRPHYHDDATREYGMLFADFDIRFKVTNDTLTVFDIVKK